MSVSLQTPQAWLARSGTAVVLSLEALRDQIRDEWNSIRTPTAASLERLFRAKLGPSDRFARLDDLNWLVVMPDTGADDALACCLRIAYQLHSSVAAPCEVGQLRISSASPAGADTLDLTPLSDEQLCMAVRRAGLDELLTTGDAMGDAAEWRGFEPVWDSHSEIIAGYRCLVEEAAGAGNSARQQQKLAQMMLKGVARLAERQRKSGQRGIIFVPITYEVLSAPPARMELLSTCRQLKCELRPQLVFEIAALGAGIPKHRLAEMVSAIQPFARAVIARSAPRNRSIMEYGGAGLKALGFDLSPSQPDDSEITRLYDTGRRLGMASYLRNVVSGRTLEHAAALGVQWISGPLIGEAVDEPAPPGRLSLDAILRNAEEPARMGAAG